MPETDHQHRHEEIPHLPQVPVPVAAHRDIEIPLHPAAKRHVPAPPEIDDGKRPVRRIEILREPEVQQQAEPHRHLAVAGKIEIELERIGKRADPRLEAGEPVRMGERLRDPRGKAVRQHDLLEQAEREQREPLRHILPMHGKGGRGHELRDHLLMVDDRPRDEMRENRHKLQIGKQRTVPRLAAVGIDEIRGLRERIEGNAERQHDLRQAERLFPEQRVERAKEKIRIFEITEQGHIPCDAEEKPELLAAQQRRLRRAGRAGTRRLPALRQRRGNARRKLLDLPPHQIVEENRGQQQRHIAHVPVAVEKERRQHEPGRRRGFWRPAPEQEEPCNRHRQEEKNKRKGIEKHESTRFLSPLFSGALSLPRARFSLF